MSDGPFSSVLDENFLHASIFDVFSLVGSVQRIGDRCAGHIRFRSDSVNVPRFGHRCAAHFLIVQKHQKSMRGENFRQAYC